MKVIHFICSLTIVFVVSVSLPAQPPKAPSQPVTETYFGKQITDPYRNLENLQDSNVINWYKSQATYTEAQLKKIPMCDIIFKEIKDEDAKYKYTVQVGPALIPTRRGTTIFFVKIMSGEQTGKLYSRTTGIVNDVLIFDPNKNNKNSALNVISGYHVNYDGSKIAIVVIQQGNEVGQMVIIDTKLKKQLDSIDRVWDPAEWIDNETFTYFQFPSADVHNSGFLSNVAAKKHKIGDNPLNDPVLLSTAHDPMIMPDSSSFPFVYTPHRNARYIIAHVQSVEQFNDVYLSLFDAKANAPLNWYPFIKKEDQITRFILQGDKAFGLSVKENKKGRVLMTSAAKPDWKNGKVIAEGVKGSLGSFVPFTITNNYLYYVEVYGVEQNLYRVNLEGTPQVQHIKTPVTGTVAPLAESPLDPGLRIFITSWTQPAIIYDYDAAKNTVSKSSFQFSPAVKGIDNTEVEVVYITSHDGIKVPLSIIKPKGIKKDRSHPVIIYGYGNYGFSMNPFFDPMLPVFAKHDVIKAVAHVRGGGEFGEEWRLGGYKSTKANTWKDAIACAEYMVAQGYTQPAKLAIMGQSAGGILAGRAMTERPDLFAVAIPQVGCLNTLRFEFTPNGPNHIAELGTVKNEDDFKNLYEMDSYMHIKDGVKYPATLITGGMNDPRVIVWQPGKFAARLQEASSSGKPVWLRIDMEGGHGIGSLKDQHFREMADILSFVLWQTNGQQTKVAKGF